VAFGKFFAVTKVFEGGNSPEKDKEESESLISRMDERLSKISGMVEGLSKEIRSLRSDMQGQIGFLRSDMQDQFERLRSRVDAMESAERVTRSRNPVHRSWSTTDTSGFADYGGQGGRNVEAR
jgi:predicted RNase H-like nuclease (RuvC/YqgF family)